MSYSITSFDEGHILLITLNADFDPAQDVIPSFNECFNLLETGPDKVIVISDASSYSINNLNELLQSANQIRTPEVMRVNRHPKFLKGYTITNSGVIQLAAKGLNSASFGFVELTAFASLEDALNQARKVLFEQNKAS